MQDSPVLITVLGLTSPPTPTYYYCSSHRTTHLRFGHTWAGGKGNCIGRYGHGNNGVTAVNWEGGGGEV